MKSHVTISKVIRGYYGAYEGKNRNLCEVLVANVFGSRVGMVGVEE